MVIKYDIDITSEALKHNLSRLTNQVYKLLPNWEEGVDWHRPLGTIMEELAGMSRLLPLELENTFFKLLCKLEGLFTLTQSSDFFTFRKTIFECLNLIGELMQNVVK